MITTANDTLLDETSVAELDAVPLERLEEELIGWAGNLAAATARWLLWLAAYDRREGWGQWGCRSAAHWLSWKCGMSVHTARVHVRVARALEDLPLVTVAFLAGELSFSKVRALTRLEGPIDEPEMIELARTATASQLDRIVAGCRQATANDEDRARFTVNGARYRQRPLPDGSVEIVLVVSAAEADQIDSAVHAAADRAIAERDGTMTAKERAEQLGGWAEVRANAATELLVNIGDHGGADPVQLVVEVEVAPSGESDAVEGHGAIGGRHLPNHVVRRLGCDAAVLAVTTGGSANRDPDSSTPGVGRKQRIVPVWLRRQLERRDHHTCRFPGCATSRRLHAHHIVHWLDLGPTDLDNLILLCHYHHHLVHESGWTVTGPADDHTIRRPDGTVLTIPELSGDPLALDAASPDDPGALHARWAGEPLDLHYAVSVLVEGGIVGPRPATGADPALN